jgi:hypothetical protein
MDEHFICSNSEACLQFISTKFDYYKQILDDDQQACDHSIASIREQACLYTHSDEKFRLFALELANQLDYFEQEAFKTYEENKTCIYFPFFSFQTIFFPLGLFKMFQDLFHLHRESAFDEVLRNEHRLAEAFQYRPSLLPNIEKLRLSTHSMLTNIDKNHLTFAATPTPKTLIPISTSFSNRADIEAFQKRKEPIRRSPIESNEIDLTKLIRETYANNTYVFRFYF